MMVLSSVFIDTECECDDSDNHICFYTLYKQNQRSAATHFTDYKVCLPQPAIYIPNFYFELSNQLYHTNWYVQDPCINEYNY